MTYVESKVSGLRAGDVIVKKSGETFRISGIANKTKGKRKLVIEHSERVVLDLDDLVEKVENQSSH